MVKAGCDICHNDELGGGYDHEDEVEWPW